MTQGVPRFRQTVIGLPENVVLNADGGMRYFYVELWEKRYNMENEFVNEVDTSEKKTKKSHLSLIILLIVFFVLAGVLAFLFINSFVTFNVTDKEYTFSNGYKGLYTGEWRGNHPAGNGKFTYTLEDGLNVEMTGEFGATTLKGEMTYLNTKNYLTVYKGTFVNGYLEGEGTICITPTESTEVSEDMKGFISYTQEGTFTGGLLNGKGKDEFIYTDYSLVINCDYVDGQVNGNYISHYEEINGYKEDFEGIVVNENKQGHGKLVTTYENGDIETIEGEFNQGEAVDGTPCTKYIATTGETLDGTVINGEATY